MSISSRKPATSPLGILAGGGGLPLEVAAAAVAAGRPVHIVALDGFADATAVARYPHQLVNLGQAGGMIQSLRTAGCRDLVIAGSLERPNLWKLRFDMGALKRWRVLLSLTRGGDDSVLRRVVRFFESEGFRVVGAGDIAPHLLAPAGPLGSTAPAPDQHAAVQRAGRLIAALGPFDVGQAVVASTDGIVAVEGVRGTDRMLTDLAPGSAGDGLGRGAMLVKLTKPGQERRVDLPTIGPATIDRARAAGLAGIAVEAGGAIVLDRPATVAAADANRILLMGVDGANAIGIRSEPTGPGQEGAGSRMSSFETAATTAQPVAGFDALLSVLARRAPTPADRRDIAVGRRLLAVLRAHGAGRAAVVEREHVRAVAASLPVPGTLTALGRGPSWGRRAFKRELGVLMLDIGGLAPGTVEETALPDIEVFRAALAAGLAGVVCLGAPIPDTRLQDMRSWANEARVFLMGENDPPKPA